MNDRGLTSVQILKAARDFDRLVIVSGKLHNGHDVYAPSPSSVLDVLQYSPKICSGT